MFRIIDKVMTRQDKMKRMTRQRQKTGERAEQKEEKEEETKQKPIVGLRTLKKYRNN